MKKYSSYIIVTVVLLILHFLLYKINGKGLVCIFYEITGLYCPGCGITRMFKSIIHLDFYQAFRYNPLIFILLIVTCGYFIIDIIYYKKYKKHIKLNSKVYVILLIVVISFGILRNIPLFSFLAPTIVKY